MNKVSEYLENDSNYYIDGGEEIITNIDKVKSKINNLVSRFDFIEFDNSINLETKNGKIIFLDKKSKLEIGSNLYIDKNDGYWYLIRSKLGDGITKFQGYGKLIYILTALEALKSDNVFVSDIIRQTTKDGRYIWNSLVDLGLAEYDENMKRFKFINNMLEDYFPDKIKNTD